MVYHPDLTTGLPRGAVYVGWLDGEHAFTRGDVDEAFVRKLKLLYRHKVRQTRGFHACPFCDTKQFGITVDMDGESVWLGSAEIEVSDQRGCVYVAPDLIYHYITAHQYLPPAEFMAAVFSAAEVRAC